MPVALTVIKMWFVVWQKHAISSYELNFCHSVSRCSHGRNSSWEYWFREGRGWNPRALEKNWCFQNQLEAVKRQTKVKILKCKTTIPLLHFRGLQVHLLWRSTVRYWSSSLWSHPGCHHQGYCDSLRPSDWIPCRKKVWMGYPRASCRVWNWQDLGHQRTGRCGQNGYRCLQCWVP